VSDGPRGGQPPSWERRLDDPTAPLFTMAVVAEVLGVDQQAIRRLDVEGIMQTARPSGNQRRYSRDDVAVIAYALSLQADGISLSAIARILQLERDVARLTRRGADAADRSEGPSVGDEP
jgi:MerR family transcriptional regulator, heat shock protein HspR